MLAQAEHDPRAAVVCVARLAPTAVDSCSAPRSARCCRPLRRASIIAESLRVSPARCCTADSLDEAVAFANEWAAEHLLLALDPSVIERAFASLRGAGTVFIGETASVAFGDYMTGANHVLPTGGLSRCYSGLSTLDFVRWTSWQRVTPAAAAALASDVGRFADSEGLPNHAAAARQWSSAPHDRADRLTDSRSRARRTTTCRCTIRNARR